MPINHLAKRKLAAFQKRQVTRSLLLVLLGDLGSNSVHVGNALLGESLAVDHVGTVLRLPGDLADELGVLKLEKAVADALTSTESVMLSLDTVSLLRGVVLTEGVNTSLTTHVELVGNRSGADVKPVGVVGREILLGTGLIIGGPLRIKI